MVFLTRGGMKIAGELPWQSFQSEDFGENPLLTLDVLDSDDEVWSVVAEWLDMHPHEPADFEYKPEVEPQKDSGVRRSMLPYSLSPMLRRASAAGYPAFRRG
jgi:hypothetical protein